MKKIGITSGINPLPALRTKSWLIAAASDHGSTVDIVESALEIPAPAAECSLGDGAVPELAALRDRKMTAYLAARELERAGCDAAVIPDIKTVPFLPEVQKELRIPIIPLLAKVEEKVKAGEVKKIALLGRALPQEAYEKIFGDAVQFIEPDEEMIAAFARVQNPCEGLRKNGLTPEFEALLVEIGGKLVARGAELLIPNCTQIARFAADLQAKGIPVEDILRDAAETAVLATPPKTPKPFKIGMIGGLGPAATVDLYDKIVRATPAKNDQQHFKVVVEQNPQIADRTVSLLQNGEDPTLALFNCAKRLEEDDCDAIIVPCNTAHAFLPYLERFIRIPFINMQVAALDEIKAKLGDKARIGLMATTGTVKTGIYARKAEAMGMPIFAPGDENQERVMDAIYGPLGAKAGYTDGVCRDDLIAAAEELVTKFDCNCLILGCTELPLILDESDDFEIAGRHVVIVDPTAALARKVVKAAQASFEKTGVR